ncbi:MAG TPA: hypothetical protein VGZ03_05055 [Acidimicrobiales bacterium]|nr:hypothetical protein [Acidimicrobiales bacterium]
MRAPRGTPWSRRVGRRLAVALVAAGCAVGVAVPARATSRVSPLATARSAPSISSLSISSVNAGETTYLVIHGSRFALGATVSLGHGVRCQVQSVTASKLAVKLLVATWATVGAHTLTVTNPDGARALRRRALHVDYQAVLARWAVGQGAVGWSTSLVRPTFTSPPTVSISGTGVTVASTTIGGGHVLDLAFTVARRATTTWRTMTITQGLASWVAQNGVRVRPAPTVTSVTPLGQNTVSQGVKVLGANFEVCRNKEPTLSISGSGVTVDSVSSALGTVLYATLTVAPTAPFGPRDVTMTNCDSGGSATSRRAFSVLEAPQVTKVDSLAVGVTRTEALLGVNFTPTTTFSSSGGDVTIGHPRYVSPGRMVATITVSPSATVGPHDVTATDGGGAFSIATGVLSVDPLPTEASLAPGGVGANTAVTLVVHGTGFRRNAQLVVGTGAKADATLSIGATTWVSSSELEVAIRAPDGTALGTDTVTVENQDGGTAHTLQFHTNPGPKLGVASSTTTVGSVVATIAAPSGAPLGETYALRVCANAVMTKGCRSRASLTTGATIGGLAPGTLYWAVATAPAGLGFYAAASLVVGPRRATSRLGAPTLRSVRPSTTKKGQLTVVYAIPRTALPGQVYAATACRNRAMTTGCVTTAHVASGGQLSGLRPGAGYRVVVVAVGSPGYLAARSQVSRAVRATVQLAAPKVTKATLSHGVLVVRFTGAAGAPSSQRYTLQACANSAMSSRCVVRTGYRSGTGVAGLTAAAYYVRIVATASAGFLAAASSVVRT